MDFTIERNYIHGIANHLTIIQGSVKKNIRTLQERDILTDEERDRFEKIEKYVQQSIDDLRKLRSEIITKSEKA